MIDAMVGTGNMVISYMDIRDHCISVDIDPIVHRVDSSSKFATHFLSLQAMFNMPFQETHIYHLKECVGQNICIHQRVKGREDSLCKLHIHQDNLCKACNIREGSKLMAHLGWIHKPLNF